MYVYILLHAEEPRFKLGWTGDMPQRFRTLGTRDRLDLSRSRFLKYASNRRACDIEKRLKETFSDYHIDPAELRANRKKHDGDTEWYRLDGFERVLRYVEENSDLIGYATLQPVLLPEAAVEAISPTESTKLTPEITFQSVEETINSDLATVVALEALHDLLRYANILVWLPEDHRTPRPEKRLIAKFNDGSTLIEPAKVIFGKAFEPINRLPISTPVLTCALLCSAKQGFECTIGIDLRTNDWWHKPTSFTQLAEAEVRRLQQVVGRLTCLPERRIADMEIVRRFIRRW